ncbi:MAG: PadR family transcriptional regulator [Corynebacterium sp.]|uniref:PadR family transcriptional regulator n=1 Tax=uncultured Corynebacterium sp. TaxID=159447 RepID=UPI0017C8BF9B|nr:PadR family transcriptional regulator [uncultured Corynebacterium sp.]NLZ58549.1 PadR family transcriptional regulator [Corynebacterium sp.]
MAEDTGFAALRRGLLEMLVLAAVEKKPRYAAEIMEALRKVKYPVQEGTVYPLLNKLRRANLVEHEWRESSTGPPRKYLSLTAEGKQRLSEFQSYWQELTEMIEGVKQ